MNDTEVYRQSDEEAPVRPSSKWVKNSLKKEFEFIALIPVWNAEGKIELLLKSIDSVVDAVIILDDGSEDKTPQVIRQCEKVIEIITKPYKELSEWNDARNRYELYLSAEKYNPKWVICLDADEVIDPFFPLYKNQLLCISSEIKAFAFHVVDVCDGRVVRKRFGHRMYRYQLGYSFDEKRLHCRLLPLEITIDEVRLTNLRIFHAAEKIDRENRYKKYLHADPYRTNQSSYEHLLIPMIDESIEYIVGELQISRVIEDGLQRELKRRIVNIEKKVPKSKKNKLQVQINNQIEDVLPVARKWHSLNLDSYLISDKGGNKFCALYSYSAERDIDVSRNEAWLIEEMHQHRDFFRALIHLAFIEDIDIGPACLLLNKLLEDLELKGVLKAKKWTV